MFFRFQSNQFAELSKGYAKGLFVVGLLLVGFGVLVYVLKEILAVFAAAVFVIIGFGCCVQGVKVFFQSRKFSQSPSPEDDFRKNVKVRIHSEEQM